MTPHELNILASAVYGPRWQSSLSRDMNIAIRTIQRWAADGISKAATSRGVLQFLDERRRARFTMPPSGTSDQDDRDDACADALEPGITALLAAAHDAGWTPPETAAALLAHAVTVTRSCSNAAVTIEVLRQIISDIKNSRDT